MRAPLLQMVYNNQRIYRFANGYGASVVQGPYTYGGSKGLYELAVTKYHGPDANDFNIEYGTPVTDDVLGYLTEAQVDDALAQIEALA